MADGTVVVEPSGFTSTSAAATGVAGRPGSGSDRRSVRRDQVFEADVELLRDAGQRVARLHLVVLGERRSSLPVVGGVVSGARLEVVFDDSPSEPLAGGVVIVTAAPSTGAPIRMIAVPTSRLGWHDMSPWLPLCGAYSPRLARQAT